MNIVLYALMLFLQLQARPAAVEGMVKNLRTGAPLADVRVTLTPEASVPAAPAAQAPVSATTDSTGRFVINTVPPGRYVITASRTLFFQPRRSSGPALLSLSSDQRFRNADILLLPTAVIAGRILDGNRLPLRSVRVEALRLEYREGKRIFAPVGQNSTDDRGEYRLFNLQPGRYMVRATQATTEMAPAYYPGVADPQNASEIRIEAGDEIGAIDLSLRPGNEFYVQFKLGGVQTGSTATFMIQRRDSKVTETLQTRTEPLPDHTYRIARLTPGSYDIFVRVMTPATPAQPGQPGVMSHTGRIPVDVTSRDVDLGTVGLQSTVGIRGRFVAAEQLSNGVDPRRVLVTLRPLDFPPLFSASVRPGTGPSVVADDGTFTIANVGVGRYQVGVTGLPAGAWLVAARVGPREVLDSGLIVSEDSGPLELTLGGSGSVGSLDGSVVNTRGDAVPFSTVVLVPTPERRSNLAAFRVATSDQSGLFTLRTILPGDYKLLAWEEVETGAYQNPDFFKDFENRGEAIRIEKGGQHSAAVRVIPAQN